jgi:transcriptional regulator with XRE-family HTH domain
MHENHDAHTVSGQRIRTLRSSANMRQSELAERVGVSIGHLSRLEGVMNLDR